MSDATIKPLFIVNANDSEEKRARKLGDAFARVMGRIVHEVEDYPDASVAEVWSKLYSLSPEDVSRYVTHWYPSLRVMFSDDDCVALQKAMEDFVKFF